MIHSLVLPACPLAMVLQQVLLQNNDKWICKYLPSFNIYFQNTRHWIVQGSLDSPDSHGSGGKRSRGLNVESRELEGMPV